jgi:hypothetical protein
MQVEAMAVFVSWVILELGGSQLAGETNNLKRVTVCAPVKTQNPQQFKF